MEPARLTISGEFHPRTYNPAIKAVREAPARRDVGRAVWGGEMRIHDDLRDDDDDRM